MKISFVAWIDYNRRSEILAEFFGATLHHISFGQRKKKWQVPIRYLVQSVQTFRALLKDRPDVVFVQNPPIVIMLPVLPYCWLFGAKYIIDSHTGAFTDFKKTLGLHKWLSKRALTTIVHNSVQEEIIKTWDVSYCVLGFSEAEYPAGKSIPMADGFNIAFSCSFAPDEPIAEVFEAARMSPDANIYITGNHKLLDPAQTKMKPANCHFTGFLSFDEYVGLLRDSDMVMALTTRDETLLSGGFEAVSLEKPLIVSDWPILEQYFSEGSVHVDNSAAGIAQGIRDGIENLPALNEKIKNKRKSLNQEWQQSGEKINHLIKDFALSK
ncbi:MAG: glycosyltransferase [Anaerolineae bacterium]